MIIHTYQTISPFPYTITSWWSIHTATFSTFSCYNLRMTNTCSNISTSSYVITSCRSMHTGTFPLPPVLYFHVNHHIPRLYHFHLCYNFIIINTYNNIFTFSNVITSSWSIHTETFSLSPMSLLHDDQHIPQLFHFLLSYLFYDFVMINTYQNFSTFSYVIT